MKKYFIFFFLIYLITASYTYGAEISNTGFIPGQIWYSKDPLLEGETIKIYTALWNNGTSPLSTKIQFYDNKVILGTRDIVIPPLQLKEASISWRVTSGDHSISAKIISPSITLSGKKETVTIDRSKTEVSNKFVPVMIKKIDGTEATSGDLLKSQIDKATSSVGDIVPVSISIPVSKNVGIVDNFREDTFKKILENKIETKDRIDEIKKIEEKKSSNKTYSTSDKNGLEDATEKPITYLKLFFLSILSFVFGIKIIFYFIIVIVVFLIFRFIYRKIRNKY